VSSADYIFKQALEYGGREFTIKSSTLIVSHASKYGVITEIFKFYDIDPDYQETKQFVWASYATPVVALFMIALISLCAWITLKIIPDLLYFAISTAIALIIYLLVFSFRRCRPVETAVFMDKNKKPIFKVHRPYKKYDKDEDFNKLYKKPEEYDIFIRMLTEKIRASRRGQSEYCNKINKTN